MKTIIISIVLMICTFFKGICENNLIIYQDDIVVQDSLPQLNNKIDKVLALSKLWSEIKYNFAGIESCKFNIDSLYSATLNSILLTSNDIDFYREIQRFCAAFKDGHTQLLYESYDWNEFFDYVPYTIYEIDRHYYFSNYRISRQARPELLGAEIIEIAGDKTIDYVEKYYLPYISSASDKTKWHLAAIQMQSGLKNTYFKGVARLTNGTITSFSILRNGEKTRTTTDKYFPILHRRTPINLRWSDNIAILQINSFNEKILPQLDSCMRNIATKAKGLVVDLRENGGGSSYVAEKLQMYIFKNQSFKTFGAKIRVNDSYGCAQGNYRNEYADFYKHRAYRIEPSEVLHRDTTLIFLDLPMVILIGHNTFSACEDFLINIAELPNRPLFIGEQTGGSTGAPLVIELPNDAAARICTIQALYPYSNKPFLDGICPDIEIRQSITELINGEDIVLKRALQELNKSNL